MLRRGARVVGIVFGTLAATLILVELGLRMLGISYPYVQDPNEKTGWSLHPGASGVWRKEGGAPFTINNQGFHDVEHSKVEPPHTIRIALLGDSFTEALQVPMGQAFWSVMQRDLPSCQAFAGQNVEVMNFGVSGYGTDQELLTLQNTVWDYSPDLVVLDFLTGNDVRNNSRTLEKDPLKPYFVERNGQLVEDRSFLQSPEWKQLQTPAGQLRRWLLANSNLGQVAFVSYQNFRARIDTVPASPTPVKQSFAPDPAAPTDSDPVGREEGIDEDVYRAPATPGWTAAWSVTEKLIQAMRDDTRAHGADFLLVTLSNGIQVHPDPVARQRFMDRLGIDTVFYPDLRLQAFAERESIPHLILAPLMQQYATDNQASLHGFGKALARSTGHWNERGHQVAGDLISNTICDMAGRQELLAHPD